MQFGRFFYKPQKKLTRFFFSGILLTLLNFVAYIILTSFYFKLDPILTVVLLTPIFLLVRFIIQSFYVFKTGSLNKKIFLKYLISFFIFFFSNIILLKIFIEIFYFNHIFSQGVIIISLAFLSFIISEKLVFKK